MMFNKRAYTLDDMVRNTAALAAIEKTAKLDFVKRYNEFVTGNGAKIAYPSSILVKSFQIPANTNLLERMLVIYAKGRSNRPMDKEEVALAQQIENQSEIDPKHCKLCENVTSKGMIMYAEEFNEFYVTPNGFPIMPFHCLLISKKQRQQDDICEQDIRTAMEYSYFFNQFVGYNGTKTGGTVNHMHFQAFPYCVQDKKTGKTEEIPLPKKLKEYQSQIGIESMFEIDEYPGEHRCFIGETAPQNAMDYIFELKSTGRHFNMMISKNTVMVVPRNIEYLYSPLTGSKLAVLETCHGFVICDAKDRDNKVMCDAETNFSRIDSYKMLHDELALSLVKKQAS